MEVIVSCSPDVRKNNIAVLRDWIDWVIEFIDKPLQSCILVRCLIMRLHNNTQLNEALSLSFDPNIQVFKSNLKAYIFLILVFVLNKPQDPTNKYCVCIKSLNILHFAIECHS